ncbi:hypothetical protein [Streptomyces parvulus]|uniref:hypothetical protein n=1 Tax=Streptomyces parvulus TaxID=146923 RepID=UPI00379F77ED
MAAIPQPPTRQCTRYNKDGSRCAGKTSMADGWCRSCDGFGRPQAAQPKAKPDLVQETRWREASARPLESDEAYEVGVSNAALNHFIAAHGGDRRSAEAQIRSLLEDLLAADARPALRHPETGRWRLRTQRDKFSVTLSRDASVVTGYKARHVDRTYAQIKAGVPSRVASPHRRERKKWFLALQTELPFGMGVMTARLFARLELGFEMTENNAAEVIEQVQDYMARAGISLPTQEGESRVTDSAGLEWTFEVLPEQRPYLVRISWGTEG